MEAVALAGTYLVLSGTGGCGDSWRPAASSVGAESRAKETFVCTLMSLQRPMGQTARHPALETGQTPYVEDMGEKQIPGLPFPTKFKFMRHGCRTYILKKGSGA